MHCAFLLALTAASPIMTLWFGGTLATRSGMAVCDEINITDATVLIKRRHRTQIKNRAGVGDVLILRENIITHNDHVGINWWCSEPQNRNNSVMMGIMGATGGGEVWSFNHDTCPAPRPSIVRKSVFRSSMPGGVPQQKVHYDLKAMNLLSRRRSGSSASRRSADGVGLMSVDQTPVTSSFSATTTGPLRSPPLCAVAKSPPNLPRSFKPTSIMRIAKTLPCGPVDDSVFFG